MPSLCIGCLSSDAEATREWFRAFIGILCRHVVLWDPGKFISCMHPVTSPMTLAFDLSGGSRHFQSPTLRFSWEGSYRDLLTVRSRYDLSTGSPPLSEPTRASLPADRGFYVRAFDGLVTRTVAGYNYRGNWASSPDGTFTR